jgi:putative hydrolase of the HAD superfamily
VIRRRADGPPPSVVVMATLRVPPSPDLFDAVIFDAGGVLILPDADAGREAIRTLGHESQPEEWHRAYYAGNRGVETMDVVDWQAIRRAIASELGIPSTKLDEAVPLIAELCGGPWVTVPQAVDVLWALSNAGYQLAVVSNAGGTVEAELQRLGICSVVDETMPPVRVVIDSHLVGIEKPDPRIFQLALDALDVEPSRSIYVGDTVRFDVLGAQAAGLYPVHVDPFDLCDADHRHVASLAELAAWLIGD